MDSFEKHLSQMKYSSPPDHLRERCLAGLNANHAPIKEAKDDSVLETFWTRWLWPHPKAWAGLACFWFICFGLNQWTLPLTQFSRVSKTSNHTRHEAPPISVMHYSLAMDSETEIWTPEERTTVPAREEKEVKPSASMKLKQFKMICSRALPHSRDQDAENAKIYS